MDVVQSLHPSAVHLGISGKTTRQTGTWNADEQYQLAYSQEEATAVVLNGQRALTLNNTVPTWPKCLACAMNDRAYTSDGSARSQECQECFDTWCWDGTDDTSTPSGDYAPVVGTVPKFGARGCELYGRCGVCEEGYERLGGGGGGSWGGARGDGWRYDALGLGEWSWQCTVR